MRGEAPVASHLLFTQPGILRDDVADERAMGISAGHAWIETADLIAVYVDRGISSGMDAGIAAAVAARVPVEYRAFFSRMAEAVVCSRPGTGSGAPEERRYVEPLDAD